MAIIEKYEPGMFSWIELATSDAAAAKAFYTSIFGWETKDMPIPDGVYTILLKNGNDLGALYQTKEIPPNWATYISVANVDDSAKKATALGAT
ncbi:MAG TPA: VOC family protein, partial [Thermoanaerobaculia bacterium]|nr:VOC family protein [Thermoanaerobaculia bacterium]